MASNASRSSGSARSTSSGTGWPVEPSRATSKQNDLRRMSYDHAVDLCLTSEPSTRTVTSGSARQSVRIRSTMPSGTSTGALTRDDLPAERGSDCRRGGAEVPGGFEEAPLVEYGAVVKGASVAETGEVERPDVHDRLESVEFVVGWLDMPSVGVDGSVDPLLVRPARAPRTGAPDQVREVGEARPAPGRFPVDRDRPWPGQGGVIGGVEESSVQQALRQAVTVVGRTHLVAELLESFPVGGRDLRVDGVEKRQGRQQVLTRRALMARVLTARSTRAAGGFVVRQRV